MSRIQYNDDGDQWDLIRWRGAVASATRGARGQAMLRELLAALDAMTEKKLIANELVENGQFCTLGVLGQKRGLDMDVIDPENYIGVAETFGIAGALAAEILYENDEQPWWHYGGDEPPEARWTRMRAWVARQIKEPA